MAQLRHSIKNKPDYKPLMMNLFLFFMFCVLIAMTPSVRNYQNWLWYDYIIAIVFCSCATLPSVLSVKGLLESTFAINESGIVRYSIFRKPVLYVWADVVEYDSSAFYKNITSTMIFTERNHFFFRMQDGSKFLLEEFTGDPKALHAFVLKKISSDALFFEKKVVMVKRLLKTHKKSNFITQIFIIVLWVVFVYGMGYGSYSVSKDLMDFIKFETVMAEKKCDDDGSSICKMYFVWNGKEYKQDISFTAQRNLYSYNQAQMMFDSRYPELSKLKSERYIDLLIHSVWLILGIGSWFVIKLLKKIMIQRQIVLKNRIASLN